MPSKEDQFEASFASDLISRIKIWKQNSILTPRDRAVMEMAMGVIESTERKKEDQRWGRILEGKL